MCHCQPGADWADGLPKTAVDYFVGSAHAGYQRIRLEPYIKFVLISNVMIYRHISNIPYIVFLYVPFIFYLFWKSSTAVCSTVWSVCGFVDASCHKICDSLFPSLDAGTRDTVCVCWADVFMLLATLVRRDSSAAYPSVSAVLGRRWRTFAGTKILSSACLYVCVHRCYSEWVKVTKLIKLVRTAELLVWSYIIDYFSDFTVIDHYFVDKI